MRKDIVVALAGTGLTFLVASTWTTRSLAQTEVSTAQPVVTEQTSYSPPNRPLLVGGVVALVGAYVPSVIVAAANDNSYDHHLYIPVVGPWMNLADRPGCGGIGQTGCGTEDGFKALLIIDGAFQGLGALATVLGFVVPERRTTVVTAKVDKPTLHVLPAQVSRDGYGVAAFGSF